MLASNQNEEAYQLLEKESLILAGEPEYDFLLGRAALRSKRPEQAMFALERVVQTQPGYAAARMELVSTYITLGLNKQAQEQLTILETQNPPPAAREAMAQFQEVLRPRLSGTPDPVHLIGLSAGYDSNVGSYPDMGLDLGGILLTVKPVDSRYSLLRTTIWHPISLRHNQELDFTLHGQFRRYQESDAQQFNLDLVHTGFLLNTTLNPTNKVGVGLQMNKLWLDGSVFRDHLGLNTFWEKRLGANFHGQLGLKLYRFQFVQSSNNYDLAGLTASLNKRWTPKFNSRLLLDVDYEMANMDRLGGDANRYKLGAIVDYRFDQRNQLSTEVSGSYTDYRDKYQSGTIYNTGSKDKARSDEGLDLGIHWRHLLRKEWQMDMDLSYRSQDSTLRFYDVDRWTGQLSLLRYF